MCRRRGYAFLKGNLCVQGEMCGRGMRVRGDTRAWGGYVGSGVNMREWEVCAFVLFSNYYNKVKSFDSINGLCGCIGMCW